MGPIDYTTQVQQPLQSALQGYQFGAAIRDDQQQQQALVAKQQAAAQQQADLAALVANPNAGPREYAAMTVKYPALREQFKQASEMLGSEQQRGELGFMTQAYSAVLSKRPDVAEQLIRDRAQAMRNSGAPEQQVRSTELWADMIKQSPDQARHIGGLMLAGVMGPEKFSETFGKLGSEGRAEEMQPSAVREGVAKADKAVADAGAAVSEATVKAVDAKNAEAKARAEIDQMAATLGLTKQQTAQAKALTGKYGAETRETLMKISQNGKPTDAQKFDAEAKLRGEYSKGTQVYTDVAEAYRRLKASNNDAAGDLSLIFSYMKMLDPGSVVREGEFATAQNAAGVPDRVRNLFNRALNGERLGDEQRKQFAAQGESLYQASQKREGEVRAGITKVARSYGLNAENIFSGRVSEAAGGTPNPQRKPLSDFDKPGES